MVVDRILLDLPKESLQNDTLQAKEIYKDITIYPKKPIIAGGINSQNIKQYIQEYNPEIIDIARGVESLPGIKDFSKIRDVCLATNR